MTTQAGAALLDRIGDAMVRPALPRHSLLSSRALRRVAHATAGEQRIEELDVPLAIVAADLVSHRQVVLRRGLLWLALVAATSIPGIYPPVRIREHVLVDGGVLNPVPTDVAADMGAGLVVAVNLGGSQQAAVEGAAYETPGTLPGVLSTILRSIEIMQSTVRSEPPRVPTVSLAPEFAGLPTGKLRNFREGRRYIEAGARAAEEALPRLEAVMPWLRRRA
jgi:NTE family protein